MRAELPDYCVLRPDKSGSWLLSELAPARDSYTPGAFVRIPYTNPRLQEPRPLFYPELRREAFLQKMPVTEIPPLVLRAKTPRPDYLARLASLQREIALGNVYELNYCICFEGRAQLDPLSVFARLAEISEAPYTALVRLGDEYILSASPELFLGKRGNRLITRPIKGTARRDPDPATDAAIRRALSESLKERTEHVMAVDVARNDLSVIAEKGSVETTALFHIDSFKTVHQMVSTVQCRLRPEVGFAGILKATFPMASMTGAPKQSAMDLISATEDFERGDYSGAMGFIGPDGDFELAVNIRCIFYNAQHQTVRIAAGGAITYLSVPEEEYAECLLKAGGLLKALNARIEG